MDLIIGALKFLWGVIDFSNLLPDRVRERIAKALPGGSKRRSKKGTS